MSLLINCESLSKSHGSLQLFNAISLSIYKGDKIGLIGPNGSGKSTFLKILSGIETPDSGTISAKRSTKVSYVPQESHFPDLSIEELVLHCMQANQMIPEHSKKTEAAILLGKLGFQNMQQSAASLSGGWKKRLEIAKALVNSPDIVLFDEPTNHLDLEGILWLETYLKTASFSYLIISHDRYFLENAANRVIEINKCYPEGFFTVDGPYSDFLEKRDAYFQAQEQYQQSLSSKVRREVEWLRQSPQARTTKARSRIGEANKLITELSELKARSKTAKAQFDFAWTDRESRKLLTATNLSKSLGEKLLFSGVNLTLSPGMRLGIVGMNGSGKTTLLKTLAGELKPDKGTIKTAEGLRIVYFDQHRAQLPMDLTLRRALAPENDTVAYRGQHIHVNSWCKRFLFSPDRLDLPLAQLSGGERARILIARLMLQPADVLLLDEPTNDLDIPTLETLEESLQTFPGAIVLITHDRYMIDQICNRILGLGTGSDSELFADYSQWESFWKKAKTAVQTEKKQSKNKVRPKPRVKAGEKLTFREKLELEGMESAILQAEGAADKLQKELDGLGPSAGSSQLQELCEKLHQAQEKLEQLYARWSELEAKNAVSSHDHL